MIPSWTPCPSARLPPFLETRGGHGTWRASRLARRAEGLASSTESFVPRHKTPASKFASQRISRLRGELITGVRPELRMHVYVGISNLIFWGWVANDEQEYVVG
jgi:hypothetical protein